MFISMNLNVFDLTMPSFYWGIKERKKEIEKEKIYERDKEMRGKNMKERKKERRIICPTFLSTIHGVAQCEARLLCSNKKTASTQTYM